VVARNDLGSVAQHPFNRVGDIALSAAVGAHNRGNSMVKIDDSAISKALKSVQNNSPQVHATVLPNNPAKGKGFVREEQIYKE
jgi:hypothetical protein